MYIMCEICKNFISSKDIDNGKFILRKSIGTSYVPEYNCKSCFCQNKEESIYILENAYPVLFNKRK